MPWAHLHAKPDAVGEAVKPHIRRVRAHATDASRAVSHITLMGAMGSPNWSVPCLATRRAPSVRLRHKHVGLGLEGVSRTQLLLRQALKGAALKDWYGTRGYVIRIPPPDTP